jgi:N-acetyl-alpha-D-muramate 1-phosphate uridylyltransferase
MPRALVLAAGRGERLRPLTDTRPKPLLEAGGKPLIAWQVEALVRGGFRDLVVNHSHLGERIEAALGDGAAYGARIRYSPESPALETAGGVARALPLLGEEPFAVVSADIHTDFDYASLAAPIAAIARDPSRHIAHLVLVDNPPWHAQGDMGLAQGKVTRAPPHLTYANIAVFHPRMFRDIAPGTWLKLFPWTYRFVDEGRVSGEHFRGAWDNVGTAEQLAALERRLKG